MRDSARVFKGLFGGKECGEDPICARPAGRGPHEVRRFAAVTTRASRDAPGYIASDSIACQKARANGINITRTIPMGDLFWNKVFGALLAVCLGVMALQLLSSTVFSMGSGGGHHGEEEGTLNDWAHSRFAYYTEIAETGGGAAAEEEVYDLGALLANADASNGERSFKAKCTTCHTIEQGGPNGTGPNLYGIMTAEHAHKSDFGYSSAMQATAGEPWTYENIDHWLENPSSYIRGTTMAFAGLRRDDERADVIAYLAQNTPNAPAFPEPLPEEETAGAEGEEGGEATDAAAEDTSAEGEAVEGTLSGEEVQNAPTEATGEIETQDVIDDQDTVAEGNESEVELAPDAAVSEEDAASNPNSDPASQDQGEREETEEE